MNSADVAVLGSHIAAIRAGSLREQVSRALEAAMVAGELKPGEMYSAPALGELFGVSATPVREAMQDLAKDGFVEAVRNRGFRVIEMSDADLDQISQIRLLLEVPTTVEVADVITPEAIERLTAIADDISTVTGAQAALKDTETAIAQLASDRANIGSNEEALGYYNNQLSSLSNNLSAAKSQITDVDVATESTNYAKENILVQSGTAMLAQANAMPQSVLRLLS